MAVQENPELQNEYYGHNKQTSAEYKTKCHNYLQNNQQSQQQPSYQNITLPEPIYDQVYAGHQPNPVALKDVKDYINNIREQIEKFDEEYEV